MIIHLGAALFGYAPCIIQNNPIFQVFNIIQTESEYVVQTFQKHSIFKIAKLSHFKNDKKLIDDHTTIFNQTEEGSSYLAPSNHNLFQILSMSLVDPRTAILTILTKVLILICCMNDRSYCNTLSEKEIQRKDNQNFNQIMGSSVGLRLI